MKEDIREINDDANKAEGIRLEYQMLREQISYSDKICVIIMGFLLAATTTLASVASKSSIHVTAFPISTLWLIGFLYFSEKRFTILKTAYYIQNELEKRHLGLGWETWHSEGSKESEEKFLHFSPYFLETILSGLVIFSNPFFVAYLLNWDFHNLLFWALLAIATVFLIVMTTTIWAYSEIKKSTHTSKNR